MPTGLELISSTLLPPLFTPVSYPLLCGPSEYLTYLSVVTTHHSQGPPLTKSAMPRVRRCIRNACDTSYERSPKELIRRCVYKTING